MTTAGSRVSARQAAQASGWFCHQAIVFGSPRAPGKVARLAAKVPSKVLSAAKAAEAKLSIECGPGIGPSASTSVLT
jgi:hypothetical protein